MTLVGLHTSDDTAGRPERRHGHGRGGARRRGSRSGSRSATVAAELAGGRERGRARGGRARCTEAGDRAARSCCSSRARRSYPPLRVAG